MSQAPAAADSGGSLLQNPKVQIGVIAAGAVAIIGVIGFYIFGGSGGAVSPAPSAATNAPTSTLTPGGPARTMAASPAMPGSANAPAAAAPAPGAKGAGGTAAAGKEAGPLKKPAGVTTRKNPFDLNTDLKAVADSIHDPVFPPSIAPAQPIYLELHKPKAEVTTDDDDPGPPIPAMRVAGVVYGEKVSATMQVGTQFMQVVPGQSIPANNPVYKVEKIEQDKVVLSRQWELNGRHGTQRFDVGLAGAPQTQGGAAFRGGAPGVPGFGGNRPGGNAPRND